MIRFREVLKDKNFLFLWTGQVISNFGDRLNQMALVALVYQRSPGSEMALAKLISFTIIPVFLIGPVAGAWVDRLNKKNVMIISDITRGLLVLSIPFFIMWRQILPVYLVIFLTFSISRFFIPSKMAIIPHIVSREKLLVANSLQDTTHMIGNVVGLVMAGIIVNIKYIGAVGGFYIDAASFFVSASLMAMIVHNEFIRTVKSDLIATRDALGDSLRKPKSIISEVREGIGHFAKYKDMRFVASSFFLLTSGIGAISCVIIIFVQDAFGTATRDLGLLGMFLVGGLFLGTLICGRYAQKVEKRRMILASFMASGVSIILFTITVRSYPNLLAAGLFTGMVGLAASPIMISTNTMTHEMIPTEMRGRIFSSLEAIIHLGFLVFMFIAAYLAKYIDRSWILIMVGGIFSLSGAAGLLMVNRSTPTYS